MATKKTNKKTKQNTSKKTSSNRQKMSTGLTQYE